MERKRRIGISSIPLIWIIILFCATMETSAQNVTYLNDKSKTYQLRAMENGKWEFQPGLYYVTLHKNYSGGYWKGFKIYWSVNKSNVKQIAPVRDLEPGLEAIAASRIQNQVDTIESLAKEETLRAAERMVDVMYSQYESRFKDSFNAIDELTTIINTKSDGALLEDALAIIDEKNLLQGEIDYIHETGPTKQMEQAKRQLAYEDVLKKLEELLNRSYKLAYYALTLNNLNK